MTGTRAVPLELVSRDGERAEGLRRLGALLLCASKPIKTADLAERLPGADVDLLLTALDAKLEPLGMMVRRSGAGAEVVTHPSLASFLAQGTGREHRDVGVASLEVVTAIARMQPCTRSDVAKLRGTEVAPATMAQLDELGWIARRGKRRGPGGATLWGTTDRFLADFGLRDLAELGE